MKYLGIDIGGTWIKGTLVDEDFFHRQLARERLNFPIRKIKSPLSPLASPDELIETLTQLMEEFNSNHKDVAAIGISTAGIVNYAGTHVVKSAEHLNVLKSDKWKNELERRFECRITMINDADGAAVGLAELGYLEGNKTIGIMPIGTGLGFSIWRNGRRWRPGKSYPLLGSIITPEGNFDHIASVSKLASFEKNHDLIRVFTQPSFRTIREEYVLGLVKVINSAAILYGLDELVICGGLADVIETSKYSMEKKLHNFLQPAPDELNRPVKAIIAKEGNLLPLLGALMLAHGESLAFQRSDIPEYKTLNTEIPYKKETKLEEMETDAIVELLWEAEQAAGLSLKSSLPVVTSVVEECVKRIDAGGRIIYVGAGTSGRIAAMDAVEIPCTYGFPEDKILALIAGGVADAAIEIESDFEEDASAVPEMLLLNIKSNDTVIGISASGSAYYVQSALAFAKERGALTIQIQADPSVKTMPFYDYIISLNSGNEVVAGSTRMKSGTATKKVLNFITSTTMIKLGKVKGPYMVDVACINNKLVERAQAIVKILYGIEKKDAMNYLEKANMNLNTAIQYIKEDCKDQPGTSED